MVMRRAEFARTVLPPGHRNDATADGLSSASHMARRRWVRRAPFALAALAAGWLGASLFVVSRELGRSRDRFREPVPEWVAERAEEVPLATRDGESLGAWFLDARREGAAAVLLLHGRGYTKSSRVEAARVFEGDGCAVMLLTHRAHGDSTGERDDFGWSARLDVVAAVEWLEHRRPDAPIVVCGMSMGAAAAAFAGRELAERVDGYILECLYRDLDSAAWCRAKMHLPAVLDWIGYSGMRVAGELLLPRWRDIAPIDAVTDIPRATPILLLAGSRDCHAPLDDTREIHSRIADHSELVILESEHGRLLATCPEEYERAVLDLVHDAERR